MSTALAPRSVRTIPSNSSSTTSKRSTVSSISSSSSSSAASVLSQHRPIIVDRQTGKRYEKGKFLGKGGFAKCYEMIDLETKKVFAGKIVSKATLDRHRAKEKLTTEIKIHRSLSNKHVVGFYTFFEDKENVYILLELCSNKSLMELQKRRRALTEPEVRYYMLQIINACKYMHDAKVIHRDLKLGNLFLDENMDIKVGDFGLATTVTYDGERKKTLCGTPNYIAPEVLDNKKGHSYEVDIWSIGCILYTMLIGRPPFETSNISTTYRKIKTCDYKIPSTANISDAAKRLIRASLSSDPAMRPSLDTMRTHAFFTEGFVPVTLPESALSLPPSFEQLTAVATKPSARRDPLRTLNHNQDSENKMGSAKKTVAAVSRSASATAAAGVGAAAANTAADLGTVASEAGAPLIVTTAASPASHCPESESGVTSLAQVHRVLSDIAVRQAAASRTDPPRSLLAEGKSNLFISKWVDYSNKYGLGYQLSDGSAGVLFNDATKIILAPDQVHVEVVDRDSSGSAVTKLTIKDYPEEFSKKVTLLKHFRSYMTENLLNGGETHDLPVYDSSKKLIHVKKWLRTKHAIVFRLSNGTIQINFFDHTKVIINTPSRTVTFIDKERKTHMFDLDEVADSKHQSLTQIVSRLSYATDVVDHMIKNGQR